MANFYLKFWPQILIVIALIFSSSVGVYVLSKKLLQLIQKFRDALKLTQGWNPPFRCRFFGHKWEGTEHMIAVEIASGLVIGGALEVCKRCRGGVSRTAFGDRYFTPVAIDDFLSTQETILVAQKENNHARTIVGEA